MSPTPAEQTVALLQSTELFGGLQEEILRTVATDAIERRYGKGEVIFQEGDPAEALLVLVEGIVKVYVVSARGGEMVLATLRPPGSLGEVSLLDGGPRSASAAAIEPTTVLALARSTFLGLIDRERSVADAMLRASGHLLRRLTGQTADLVFLDLEGRVAKLLASMADERGERVDGELTLDLGVTQNDLAAMVGGSRQSVNQILHALAAKGIIRLEHRTVSVVEEDALRRRAT
jgi:CRP-like cAMP-binding protein